MPRDPARRGGKMAPPGSAWLCGLTVSVRAAPSAGMSGNSPSAKGSLPAPLHEDCGSRLGQGHPPRAGYSGTAFHFKSLRLTIKKKALGKCSGRFWGYQHIKYYFESHYKFETCKLQSRANQSVAELAFQTIPFQGQLKRSPASK